MATVNGNARANRLNGTTGDDVITGFGGDDTLTGGEGYDVLYGDDAQLGVVFGSGDDRLDGGGGRDALVGGGGADRLSGGDGDDLLIGGSATNVINTEDNFQYSYALSGDGGNDSYDGGRGIDRAILSYDRAQGISLDISDPQARAAITQNGVEIGSIRGVEAVSVFAGSGDDRLVGGARGDGLVGRGGDDVLLGGGGFDQLEGGAGNDTLDGGADFDVVSYAQAAAGVTIDLRLMGQAQDTVGDGIDTLIGIEQVDGSRFSDTIRGSDEADTIGSGDGGSDRIDGGDGNDFLTHYRFASDTMSRSLLIGGDGDDVATIAAATGARDFVTLRAGAGADTAYVIVSGHARVEMGGGEDRVVVGLGNGDLDIVLGRGVDTINFEGFYGIPADSTAAHALDFVAGNNGDRIDLRALLLAVAPDHDPGSDPFAGGFARLLAEGSGTAVQIDRDAGGTAFGFQTILIVDESAPEDFAAFNFGGWSPVVGTADAAGQPVVPDLLVF